MEVPKPRNSRLLFRSGQKRPNERIYQNSDKDIMTTLNLLDTKSKYSYYNFIDIPNPKTGLPYTLISSSQTSKIFLTQNSVNKKIYVKKTIDLSQIPNFKPRLKKIISLYKAINHENIIKLYSSHKDKSNKVHIISQYAPKGNLESILIKNGGGFTEEKSFIYFYQIVRAMQYLHSNKIILRNLKPENILVGKHDHVYLYDFSEFKKKNKFYDYSEDLWSLGVILYVLTQGITKENGNNINNNNFNFKTKLTKECQELILKLLDGSKIKSVDNIFEEKWMMRYLENPNNFILSQFKEFTKEKCQMIKTFERKTSRSQETMEEIDEDFNYIKTDMSIDTINSDLYSLLNYNNTRQSSNENYQSNKLLNLTTMSEYEDGYDDNGRCITILSEAKKNKVELVFPEKTEEGIWDKFTSFFVGSCK